MLEMETARMSEISKEIAEGLLAAYGERVGAIIMLYNKECAAVTSNGPVKEAMVVQVQHLVQMVRSHPQVFSDLIVKLAQEFMRPQPEIMVGDLDDFVKLLTGGKH